MHELSATSPSTSSLFKWNAAIQSLTRSYAVTPWMVLLVTLVPFYIVISEINRGRARHAPALAWDHVIPLQPAWALIYGALYLFLILLPVLIVHQHEQVRRTVFAYLTVWIAAYICFIVYPTTAPRPEEVAGDGFAVSGLRFLYDADPPRNCFPSLHVAHSCVSALTCYRVHRRVGAFAGVCALLVAVSTLYTKQHYVLDVIAGAVLAGVAYAVFLHRCPRGQFSEHEQHAAPALALGTLGVIAFGLLGVWIARGTGLGAELLDRLQ